MFLGSDGIPDEQWQRQGKTNHWDDRKEKADPKQGGGGLNRFRHVTEELKRPTGGGNSQGAGQLAQGQGGNSPGETSGQDRQLLPF